MSTSTPPPKKPPSSGSGSTPSTARKAPASSTASSATGTNLNRSPSRIAANSSTNTTSTTTTASMNRARSVRNGAGTPVSARAAARKPASDSIASSDDDARVEMQARLDELQQKLLDAEQAASTSEKQSEVLQIRLDEALKEQVLLEDNVHEHIERIEELENEKREVLRAKREQEQIFESERAAALKEREEAQSREDEMQRSIVRMKESLSQQRSLGVGEEDIDRRGSRPLSISRTSSFRSNNASPNPEGQFAPSSSAPGLQRSDSRSSSRLVHQKDKIIEGLRLELAEAQIKLVEMENKGGAGLQVMEREMYEIKMQNARLMEENESFQLLLRDKTLNGDFATSELLRAPSSTMGDGSRPPSRYPDAGRSGTNLADELDAQQDDSNASAVDGDAAPDSAAPPDSKERRLQGEVNGLKDQNKALTLYINNIISRLLQHEQFEQILDKTPDLMAGPGALSRKFASIPPANIEKELPPPPPPKDDKMVEEGQSLLQRAGSVLRGRGAKPPRPMSQMLTPDQAPKTDDGPTVHENPDTAPRIPLGRSASTRAGSHKRASSDWPAASVVTSMYKGPSPGLVGPASPGLGSPTAAGRGGSFFPLGAGVRSVSGNQVPTIDEIDPTGSEKENQMPPPPPPHRDSKVPPADSKVPPADSKSQRNSVVSDPSDSAAFADPAAMAALTGERGDLSSNPSSPPRSTTSSGERDSRAGSGGAIMMGSKPRPLRLVQATAAQEESKAGNRGSWFGWMNKGQSLMPGRSVSGEGQQQQQ